MGRESNKKRRAMNAATAREKAAAARAEQQRADQRRRAMAILSTVVVLALIGAVIAVVVINHKSKSGPATVASQTVLNQVTSVPVSVSNTVGAGTAVSTGVPVTIQGGTSLASGGKPTLLYIGAEFCPFCAAERWAIIQSLSKFGTLTGEQQITSSEDSISTYTFVHAKYTSKYLNFDGKEQADQNHDNLQPLTSTENAQWTKYLAPNAQGPGYPFLDFNGQYISDDPMIDPTVLIGKTWAQIGTALSDPTSPIAKAVDGAANYLTSTICKLTNEKPATVCTASIQSLTKSLQPYKA
jgi:hypothetical protein